MTPDPRIDAVDRVRQRSTLSDAWAARMLVVAFGVLIVIALGSLLVGLLGAVVLYEVCSVPYSALTRRFRNSVAATMVVLAVLVVVAGPMILLGYHLASRVPTVIVTVRSAPTNVTPEVGAAIEKAKSAVSDALPSVFRAFSSGIASALLNWSIALLGLYYLLVASDTVGERVKRLLPFSPESAELLGRRLHDTSVAILLGTLLSSAVQGASIGIGFFLARIPDALFWAVCGAVTTLVPVVGNAIVWLPALLYLLVTKRYDGAIAMAIFAGLGPPIIDRVVRASVSSRVGQVHPMITLVGALAGIQVAGVAGLFIGPIALEMFFVLADVCVQEYPARS